MPQKGVSSITIVLIETGESKIITVDQYGVPSDETCIPSEIELPWCFVNHSCEPNTYENWLINLTSSKDQFVRRKFLTCKPINQNEEITYDYFTVQYESSKGFDCFCKERSCRGSIHGFHLLTKDQQASIRDKISYFLYLKLINIE